MITHILGFPRMGVKRELKFALESFWQGQSTAQQLEACGQTLRLRHWTLQQQQGLSSVVTGDFSLYDHMLDTTVMLGAEPQRFRHRFSDAYSRYFAMARGDQRTGTAAMEMTKWFNTNYHFIVPEIDATFEPRLNPGKIVTELEEAKAAGFTPKQVLIGPFTWLGLSKGLDGYSCWQKLEPVIACYAELLALLAPRCAWIQIDEPILCAELPSVAQAHFAAAYQRLVAAATPAKLLLTTYFDTLDDHLDLAFQSGCAGVHLDLVRGGRNLDEVLRKFPQDMMLSAGIVEGRNIWKNDFDHSLAVLERLRETLGERLMVASSCSLLHAPIDLEQEKHLDSELRRWMAFAKQKCEEVALLGDMLDGNMHADERADNRASHTIRRASSRVHDATVQQRLRNVTDDLYHRKSPYLMRKHAQRWLNLPLFPTTTIGSFPQTQEIRHFRQDVHAGKISPDAYREFIRKEIAGVIQQQEKLGLDVLVHGEPERNDMVEYFGQQLNGFCFTEQGWVQSYGSRCVKPPIIFGDVSRPAPMTVAWIAYAQSLTTKPVKGMLTGPVTILCWSFVRDDLPREEVCKQIALAILDEVRDLERANIRIIQIDEAALSEGMPIKARDRSDYFRWAVDAFKLATSDVADATNIHTHMCYSEFNTIIHAIAEMDADVISIESSRSKMELLEAFRTFAYPNEIGPGVYDIHSPRVPSREEIVSLLHAACRYIPMDRIWVNPDCGLKTRKWEEVIPALRNMVAAAHLLRKNYPNLHPHHAQ